VGSEGFTSYNEAIMTVRVTTRVLPGRRIEISAAELREGQDVEVTIETVELAKHSPRKGILDFINTLPPSTKSAEEWAEFEKEFRQERDSWDR
jgi:hypothetical protein